MPQDQIESRRAFMKKLGKLAGAAAVAAPFMAMAAKEVIAKPKADTPTTDCNDCSFSCANNCVGSCTVRCVSSNG